MTEPTLDRSYRALFRIPALRRAIFGMLLSRIGEAMVGVAMVLFALTRYRSPELAGLLIFVSIVPGLVVSPIAGALLDRHGRVRLVVADLLIALVSLALIGILALADALPIWLLLLIAALSSLTAPLSNTGLRTLFPLMAPRHLWEPLNGIDASGYVVATILGPPVAAVAVGLFGGPTAIILTASLFGIAAIVLTGVPEPPTETVSTGNLLSDAWQGLRYSWANRTIRGIGFAVSTQNVASGMIAIVVPVLILEHLALDEGVVGLVFAAQGVAGTVAGLAAGRIDTRGRERTLIALPILLMAPAIAFLLLDAGLPPIILTMVLLGVLTGPLDVAMFTLRQRRTDPAWMGRAFAISMSANFAGYPIGSALAGLLVSDSTAAPVVIGIAATLLAGLAGWRLIPRAAEAAATGPPLA